MIPLVIAVGAGAVVPFLVRAFVDNITSGADIQKIASLGGKILILQSIVALSWWIGEYGIQTLQRRCVAALQKRLFSNILRVPAPFFWKNPTGILMAKVSSDAEMVGRMAPSWLPSIIAQVINIIVGLIVLYKLDVILTGVTVLTLPIYYVVAKRFSGKIQKASVDERQAYSTSTEQLREGIEGAVTVKLLTKEDFFTESYSKKLNSWLSAIKRVLYNQILAINLLGYVVNISPLIVLGIGGIMAAKGMTTIGTAIAFFTYVGKLFNPIRNIADTYNTLQQTYPMADRLLEILRTQKEEKREGKLFPKMAKIQFKGVSFEIEGKTILRDINLTIEPEESLAIVGGSGAGKSTLVSLLPELILPSQGEILINKIPLEKYSRKEIRKNIKLVTSNSFLFNMSIRENILLGEYFELEKFEKAIHTAKVDEFVTDFNQVIGERGISLSDGQKQRIALTRAILRTPRVLILDEATSAVDAEIEEQIFQNLEEMPCTNIIISHRLSTISKADKIVVMRKGEICAIGNHKELLRKSDVYKNLIQQQLILK